MKLVISGHTPGGTKTMITYNKKDIPENLQKYFEPAELGLESTFEEYINKLCNIFDGVKRILKKDGTCWVVIGDTYGGTGIGQEKSMESKNKQTDGQYELATEARNLKNIATKGIYDKCLLMIPFRFAIEMVNRDTMDIYELDKSYILCNNIDITNNITGVHNAIQRQGKSKRIFTNICKEMEECPQGTIPQPNDKVARGEQGQDTSIQPKILLASSRTGNNQSDERKYQETQTIKNGSNNTLWWKSSEVCLLWGDDLSISNDRPYQREDKRTQSRINKIWLNLRMVKENELSARFQSFVHELQLVNREIWILPPSRGKNLCIRKRDIPIELLPLFKLYKEERWCLRNTIIWHKPNCMPASVKDRFTVDFEYVFFFVKNKKYWFEQLFDEYTEPLDRWGGPEIRKSSHKYIEIGEPKLGKFGATSMFRKGWPVRPNEIGRNKRCVWQIKTAQFPEAHFAVYPEELIEPMVRAGCPENGVIIDPFMGSGTTGVKAKKLGRNFIGIEINPDYVDIANRRLANTYFQPELIK